MEMGPKFKQEIYLFPVYLIHIDEDILYNLFSVPLS